MRFILILSAALFFLPAPAHADQAPPTTAADEIKDYKVGLDAYNRKDYVAALKILRPLSDQGNPYAQDLLGMMYESGEGVNREAEIQTFATQYKKANDLEKLQLCINAMSRGLIRSREPVADLDKMFGTNYSTKIPTNKDDVRALRSFEGNGVIHFSPQPPSSEHAQAWLIGWYLGFTYNGYGFVENYELTNQHK